MTINPDCMRMILKYCVNNIDYKEIDMGAWFETPVSLDMLYSSKELKNYERKEIMYSVMKLYEYGYITLSNIYPNDRKYIDSCTITDVNQDDLYNIRLLYNSI